MDAQDNKSPDYAYWDHRTIIGALGTALPLVLWLGAIIIFQTKIQDSLSSYYYTGMRNVFVGVLWALGIFFFSYKGYERSDDWAGNLAGLFAVCVTLFPTTPLNNPSVPQWIGIAHLIFAALFFLILIYFAHQLFTRHDPQKPLTPGKILRNKIYKGCAYVMAVCLILMAIYHLFPGISESAITNLNPIFWLESVAIWAFGISWFFKGEELQRLLQLQ